MGVKAILCLLTGLLTLSCTTGSFSGSGQSKKAKKTEDTEPIEEPKRDRPKSDPRDKLEDDKTDDDEDFDPSTDIDATEDDDLDSDTIFDVLGGILNVLNDVDIDQPDEDEVIFGRNKVFHIGDGEFAQSSCLAGISPYRLRGTQYYFEFEVLEGDTNVDIAINRICGVDLGDTNFIYLRGGAGNIEEARIMKGAMSYVFRPQTLPSGRYQIIVESRRGSNELINGQLNPNDHDDYIVGDVRIKASKRIRPGRVGATN